MNSGDNPPKKLPRTMFWIVWFALIQGVILYFVVLKFADRPESTGMPEAPENLRSIFLVVGVIVLIISFAIRFTVTARGGQFALPSYIASLALAEVPAIFGLLLGLLGGDLSQTYLFFGMGFLGLIAQPPTILPK